MIQGYWQRPDETARAFLDKGGVRWMRTGDLVRMDDEGYFHFYDRSKDLIKFKGYSIFAKDVEDDGSPIVDFAAPPGPANVIVENPGAAPAFISVILLDAERQQVTTTTM